MLFGLNLSIKFNENLNLDWQTETQVTIYVDSKKTNVKSVLQNQFCLGKRHVTKQDMLLNKTCSCRN